MMRHSVTVPLADNDGRDLAPVHAELRARLLDIAGGFSEREESGYWRAPNGRVHAERNVVYTVDTTRTDDIRALCRWLREEARQECIYLAVSPVDVDEIRTTREIEEARS